MLTRYYSSGLSPYLGNDSFPGVFVSSVQTVGDSSNSSCVSTDPSPMSSFFTLAPPAPSTCSWYFVFLNYTRYQEQPDIRVLIPGGQAIKLGDPIMFKNTIPWSVNVRQGTQVVVFVESSTGLVADSRTSPLITVTASQNDDCLSLSELKSTVILSTDTHVSTVTASTAALPVSTITASITGPPESTKKVK